MHKRTQLGFAALTLLVVGLAGILLQSGDVGDLHAGAIGGRDAEGVFDAEAAVSDSDAVAMQSATATRSAAAFDSDRAAEISASASGNSPSRGEVAYEVLVVWPDGQPAAECDVWLGESWTNDRTGSPDAVTDSAGRARVLCGEAEAGVVRASTGAFESLPRGAAPGKPVQLELLGTVAAEGSLKPHATHGDVDMTVTCYAVDGARRVRLARRRASVGRAWRMENLPIAPLGRFVFRFESDSTVPLERARTAVTPGETLRVDVDVQPGSTRQVRVLDQDDAPIEGAEVIASYVNTFNEVVRYSGYTDAEGRCALHGVPPREGDLIARKKGYEVSSYGWPIHGLLPEDEVWEIEMARAAPVKGRCVVGGSPVTDFDIVWCPRGMVRSQTREFRGAPSGEFELLELGPGEVSLVATCDALGQTTAKLLSLPADGLEDVVLEFPDRAVITGAVVDAFTEAPIVEASIQPWTSSAVINLSARGESVLVDASGRFRGVEFNVGLNRFEVSAPGYAPRMQGVFVESGKDGDAGVIRLSRSQTLRIELLCGPDNVVTECYASGTSAASVLPALGFDASGALRYGVVAPGSWRIRTSLSTGHQLYSDVQLIPGEEWGLRVNAERLVPWNVALREANGQPVAGEYGVRVAWRDAGNPTLMSVYVDENGVAQGLAPRDLPATLHVFGPGDCWLHQSSVEPEDYKQDPFVVRLGTESSTFRIVDGASAPVAGATAYLLVPGLPFESSTAGTSAADGSVRLVAPNDGSVDVSVFHPTLGVGGYIGLGASDRRAGCFELELDPVGRLEVFVRDGASAVAGAELGVGVGGYWMSRPRTDGSGLARSAPLNAGAWRVRFDQPGYWPAEGEFVLKKDSKPFELQVRALGEVEIEVRDAGGLAVGSCGLELVHEELRERASDWLAANRIRSSTGELRTDRFGKLTLTGLPHGEYRWSALSDGELLSTDSTTIAPRTLTKVVARLP